MGEIGLDSLRHGEAGQARGLEAQLGSVFAGGVAGAFAFAWTDEWHCGGVDIEDWAFGLTRREPHPQARAGDGARRDGRAAVSQGPRVADDLGHRV